MQGLYFYTPEQHKMDSGKIVAHALHSMGGESTKPNLMQHISCCLGENEEEVESLITGALRRGVQMGFLLRRGMTYKFPTPSYQIDSDRRKRKTKKRSLPISPSRSPTKSPRNLESKMLTPHKEKLNDSKVSAERVAAANQAFENELAAEHKEAMTSYRETSSKRSRRVEFQPTSTVRSKRRRRSPTPEISPSRMKKFKIDDHEEEDDDSMNDE